MTVIEKIRSGYHVVGIDAALKAAKSPAFVLIAAKAASGQIGGDETEFDSSIRLAIENNYYAEQPSEPTPCKWVNGLALCRNPYATTPHDKWLLAQRDGTAFFVAATPVLCRIYLHTINKKLQLA